MEKKNEKIKKVIPLTPAEIEAFRKNSKKSAQAMLDAINEAKRKGENVY